MQAVIEPARAEHLAEISVLAHVIWRAHYPGIISREQIDYMLARMYDVTILRREIERGVAWFRATVDGQLLGFASVSQGNSMNEFKLHKLYVYPDWQRHGLGRALLNECEATAKARGANTVVLNVNKQNTVALNAYRRLGFAIRESVIVDIGGGFVMNDYVLAKALT